MHKKQRKHLGLQVFKPYNPRIKDQIQYNMKTALFLSASLLFTSTCWAGGVSPYLPISASPVIESDIESLATLANIPQLTKPYNLAVVFQALDKIQLTQPDLYARLSRSLMPYKKKSALTHSRTTLSFGGSEEHALPNERGNTTDNTFSFSNRFQWQAQDWLGFYVGTELTQQRKSLAGSMLSVGTSWAQLDIGYKDHWYSPFQSQSMVISTNAETMPSVSLSNNLPIEFFDTNFNYEFFLSQMDTQPVRFNGKFSTRKKPLLAGFHFSFEPVDGWMIGVNRVVQFGGGEREVSFKTIAKAFVDPDGADNAFGDKLDTDEEAGNQIASITSRFNFDTKIPFSFYSELAGEDTSNSKNYQFGNPALSAGLFFPQLFNKTFALTYEYSFWENGWYSHHIYKDGYTNDGFVVGNWALQQQRENSTALEGESQYIKGVYRFDNEHKLITQVRLVTPKESAKDHYKQSWEVDAEYFIPWRTNTISVGAYLGNDQLGKSFWQARVSYKWK